MRRHIRVRIAGATLARPHFSLYERVRFSLKECYHTIIALRFTFFGAVLHDIQGSRQKYAHRVVTRHSTRLTIRRAGARVNMAFQGDAEFGEVEESEVNCYKYGIDASHVVIEPNWNVKSAEPHI